MPLIKGSSKKIIGKNISIEMKHGKSQKQSIAIAMSAAHRKKIDKMKEMAKYA